VRGSSATNVWAVGARGASYRYNGTNWQAVPTGTMSTLFDVMVMPDAGAYAVGESGLILNFAGNAWSPISYGPSPLADAGVNLNGSTAYDLGGVYSDGNKIWAVGGGGVMVEIVGTVATVRRSSKLSNPLGDLTKVWARNSTEWWAVGDFSILRSSDGINWTNGNGAITALFGIWGAQHPTTNQPVLVGCGARVLAFDYTQPATELYPWQPPDFSDDAVGVTKDLRGVWFDNSGFGYLVGLDGAIVDSFFGAQKRHVRQVSPTFDHLLAVWGTSRSNVWAVGGRSTGIILRRK
jgi:hypothetical protein